MALRLNGSNSGYVELEVPADAGSHTLTLPNSGGSSGQYLQTNGSGTLSWQTVPANLVIGTKFQWMQATSVSVGSGNAWTDAGVDFTYTPQSSTSVLHISLDGVFGGTNNCSVRLRETANSVSNILDVTAVGSSSIGYGDFYDHGNNNWGYRHQHLTWHYAPGVTSELTFDLQVVAASAITFYVGRMESTSNAYELTSGVQLSIIEYEATRSELT